MNKKMIFSLFAMLLLLVGCDYNDKYFDGYDDNPVTETVRYEGDFTGKYPSEGYFADKDALQAAVSSMLSEMYPYCDKGSAKVNVLFGDITKGFQKADVSYTLTNEDYDAMGEGDGQPGKYNNFDSKMDVDVYLKAFCAEKYADLTVGKTVCITYKYFSGSVSNLTKTYEKTASGWNEIELSAFVADSDYTLVADDYDSMGTASGQPGRYDNFDSNMDVDFYLGVFLKQKFPYTKTESTCAVTYQYYSSGGTAPRISLYKFDGTNWTAYDPYEDIVEVSTKVAEMAYNGTTWTLSRLVGGTMKITFEKSDYEALLDWVFANKPEYKSTKYDNEEFYFGVSTYYPNVNNVYSTWKNTYNINDEYTGKTDAELQAIMDERLAWGIAEIVLPRRITTPDTGLSYAVTYTVYGGRGSGNYAMSFMYNGGTGKYENVSEPVAQ